MSHIRTLAADLLGAHVELDQRVRLLYAGNRFEPADYQITDIELRVNDFPLDPQRFPFLVRAVEKAQR
jgi:hypothetical protein